MKKQFITSAVLLLLLVGQSIAFAQKDITVTAPTSEAAEGLDLMAVGELFKDSKNLEEFEKALNDPKVGVNNLFDVSPPFYVNADEANTDVSTYRLFGTTFWLRLSFWL